MKPLLAVAAVALFVTLGGGEALAQHATEVIGRLELAPGIPCAPCSISVDPGAAPSASTSAGGTFRLRYLGAGTHQTTVSYTGTIPFTTKLIVVVPEVLPDQPGRPVADIGTVVVVRPGGVTGRVVLDSSDDLDAAVVGVEEQGIFVQPSIAGYYLIPGVAPGRRKVTLYVRGQAVRTFLADVPPGKLVKAFDPLLLPGPGPGPVITH